MTIIVGSTLPLVVGISRISAGISGFFVLSHISSVSGFARSSQISIDFYIYQVDISDLDIIFPNFFGDQAGRMESPVVLWGRQGHSRGLPNF